jgi:hypothetical protein
MADEYLMQFGTSLPDDTLRDGDTVLKDGGEGAAVAVFHLLREARMRPYYPSLELGSGWEMRVRVDERLYTLRVTGHRETFVLGVAPTFSGGDTDVQEFLGGLYNLILNDGRFTAVSGAPRVR